MNASDFIDDLRREQTMAEIALQNANCEQKRNGSESLDGAFPEKTACQQVTLKDLPFTFGTIFRIVLYVVVSLVIIAALGGILVGLCILPHWLNKPYGS